MKTILTVAALLGSPSPPAAPVGCTIYADYVYHWQAEPPWMEQVTAYKGNCRGAGMNAKRRSSWTR